MVIHGRQKLVDALARWGLHEAETRLQGNLPEAFVPPPAAGPARALAGVELPLRVRSPYIGRILQAGPLDVLEVEFEPEDRSGLFIADGRTLPVWAAAISAEDSEGGRHVLRLAHAPEPVRGRLVCAIHTHRRVTQLSLKGHLSYTTDGTAALRGRSR